MDFIGPSKQSEGELSKGETVASYWSLLECIQVKQTLTRSTHPNIGPFLAEGSNRVACVGSRDSTPALNVCDLRENIQKEAAVHPGMVPKLGVLTPATAPCVPCLPMPGPSPGRLVFCDSAQDAGLVRCGSWTESREKTGLLEEAYQHGALAQANKEQKRRW